MPKSSSSRHKSSHRQSKHNSRHARDHSDSEEEDDDVKVVKNTASRGSRDSRSGEKRKLASVSQNGADCSGNDNADELEKNFASKRQKVEDLEKSSKSKSSKALSDSKSKSSRRKEENVRLKTESKSKNSKEKHNTELHLQEDLQIRRRDGSVEKDKYQDNTRVGDDRRLLEKDKHQDSKRDGDDKRLSSMGERAKDGRYKDKRQKDESSRDNSREVDRNSRYRDGKQRVDDKEKRHREGRHRNEHSSTDRLGNRSDSKIRDESNAEKSRSENSHRDGNLIYDDRSIRCKVDKEKRSHDKEGESDTRSQTAKEQCSDAEKKFMNISRYADVDSNTNHNRKRRSPCFEKDQYRRLKQAENDYMDSMPEDRVQHDAFSKEVISVSGLHADSSASLPMDKLNHIDYNLSCERSMMSDACVSPVQLFENSPSSTSIEHKNLTRSGAWRSFDVEGSGKTSGGINNGNTITGNESKGSHELPLGTPMDELSGVIEDADDLHLNESKRSQELLSGKPPMDDFSQADGDNFSSSSFKSDHLPTNFRSIIAPLPRFRAGVDSPSVFDSRGKSNNCYKRTCNSNMGRVQGNPWKGVRNWPSPVINGFAPFQHGPHPMGFHPVMQQFSAPPMFGVRPSMELNHSGIPYHVAETERFSSHGPPFGWQNFVDGLHPPPLCHGWDANNGITRDEAHACGRLSFEHNRSSVTSQGWEASVDMWKGQSGGVTEELPSVPEKKDRLLCAPEDDFWVGQSSEQAQNEENQPDLQVENIDIGQPSDGLAKEISSKASNSVTERCPNLPKISRDYDDHHWLVYLSKLDISADLTHPEIYNQCTSIMDLELKKTVDHDSSKFLYLEEVVEARVKVFNNNSNASLFAAINDSVFQRAMSFYKKQREETREIFVHSLSSGEKICYSAENLGFLASSDQEKVVVSVPFANEDQRSDRKNAAVPIPSANEEKLGELAPTCDKRVEEGVVASSSPEKPQMPINSHEIGLPFATSFEKIDEPILADSMEDAGEFFLTSNLVKMDVDMVKIECGSVNLSRIHHSPESTH